MCGSANAQGTPIVEKILTAYDASEIVVGHTVQGKDTNSRGGRTPDLRYFLVARKLLL
jgi:hypothetical protein